MRHIRVPAALAAAAWLLGVANRAPGEVPPPVPPGDPASVTVPFTVDHGRMIVEVDLRRPDGTVRRAAAWVDTGGEGLALAEPLAREVGGGDRPPSWLSLGGMPLDVAGVSTRVGAGSRVLPGVPAEVHLPASALRRLRVVFDYPARRLTLARSGSLAPRGAAVPCRVHPLTGLFQVAAVLDGEAVSLAVDNGSSSTWVSNALLDAWLTRHSRAARATGAAGTTNFFGFPFEAGGTLARLPEIGLGPHRVRDVAVLGLDKGLFDWYSKKTAEPVVGFVGANVLRGFRLEVDFPGQVTYWEAGPPPEPDDLDTVGLTLRPGADGNYAVAGVVTRNGQPAVEGVEAGDRLLRIDGLETTGATMGTVADALRGRPGEKRALLLERQGKRIEVEAKVSRLP